MAKKNKAILFSYRMYILIPAAIVAAFLIITIVLVSLYSYTRALGLMIAFGVMAAVTLIAYILFYVRLFRRLKDVYYNKLFETTYTNINKLRNNDLSLVSYGDSEYKEIRMLDKAMNDIKVKFDSSYMVLKNFDYSSINLEYVDKEKNLITYDSFKENLANIIYVSQSFRNIIIDVYYDIPANEKISKKEQKRLLNLYSDAFKEHENVLYMFANDERSLIIYVPIIDSFSEIKEKLNLLVTSSSIMIRDNRGITNILAKYAIVAYPYSNEDMILGDLSNAKRQGKPFNLYLPTRLRNNVGMNMIQTSSMNLNYTSKIITELSHLDYSATNNEKNYRILTMIFEAVSSYLDVDEAGIIYFNKTMNNYYSYVASSRSELFKNKTVSKEFVDSLGSVVDDDDVYYFSTRKHASQSLQQTLGLYGINSGVYYIVRNLEDDGIFAIIYMFNRNRDMVLNTYLRETFLVISLRIENYFEKRQISDYADAKDVENQNILTIANMYAYHVDNDFNITYVSKSIKKLFRDLEEGEKCYHKMFGLDKPCKDCPLLTKKKKYFDLKNNSYEASLALTDAKGGDKAVLIKKVQQDQVVGDLFQEDFLTYSFKSLVNTVHDEFTASSRGYIVLLSIDNYDDILTQLGSEGYNQLVRTYVRNLKNKLNTQDIYFYNPTTLAVHLPSVGHKDIITKIESIYPLSKEEYNKNKGLPELSISYLPVGYPRGYALAEDYLKHMSDFYRSPAVKRGKDFIYFSDLSIERSASKRAFMLSVLEQEFSGHNSNSMNLQPIVRVKDGHIYGAEILLRIADAHRNVFFNAQEISRIAEQEKKTGMITESIINFVGTMYKEYGNNIFKINKFNRIAINIDQTYLDDQELVSKLIILCEENHLPNGFISLEIPEDLIPENKDKIKRLASELSKYKIMFSCDRYMGHYTNIEELAFLGFKEAKIARDIILAIDTDQVRYSELKNIVETAKKNHMNLAAVGVENAQQFKILKDLDDEMVVQGYYLYKPLTRADLIAALISYEK